MNRRSGAVGAAARIAVAFALLCVLATACGKKGNPLPPARVIPNPTKDLVVTQRGIQIVLRFAYPETTTAGAKLPGLEAVEVWSMTRPLPAAAGGPPPIDIREFTGMAKQLATLRGAELTSAIEGGQVVLRLPLPEVPPAAPADAPPAAPPLHVYAVRTVAAEGEASAWSNLATLVPQAPPLPPMELAVAPRAGGIELAWQAAPGVAGFAVYRRPAASRSYGEPIAALPAEARSYLDESARYGKRYIYTLTAMGAKEPRVESAFGEEREVDYQDRFAPAPPTDLEALPQASGVRLLWQPSPDGDAAGYLVYRQDEGGEWHKITPEPLADLKHVDSNLSSGLLFRYRVTAVDATGNEGPPTPVVEVRPR